MSRKKTNDNLLSLRLENVLKPLVTTYKQKTCLFVDLT